MRIGQLLSSFHSESPEKQDKALYLQELEDWKNQGVAREKRADTVSKIKAFMKNPEQTKLCFSHYHLTSLPPLGLIAERIKSLVLSDNQLSKLPESIRELHNLKVLCVSDNPDLQEIPPSLLDSLKFRLLYSNGTKITKTLQELRLKRVEDRGLIAFHLLSRKILPRLPESSVLKINDFRYLEELEAWGKEGVEGENRDMAVSEINAFIEDPEKTALSFRGCHLTTLPPLGFIAERIKSLNLEGNQFSKLPESPGELHNLEVLYLNLNKLQEFPEWIGVCHKLRKLNLCQNQISKLPDSLGKLSNLEILWVSYNPDLKEIPLSLLESPNLRHLSSRGTQIRKNIDQLKQERQEARAEIAFSLLLGRIKTEIRLTEIPVSQVNYFVKEPSRYLTELEDWKNQGVPREERAKAISNIKAFMKNSEQMLLSLLNCHLTTLPPLGLIAERIKILSLVANDFRELPELLGKLSNLKVLRVSRNPALESIPSSLLNSPNFMELHSKETKITKTLKELREEWTEEKGRQQEPL